MGWIRANILIAGLAMAVLAPPPAHAQFGGQPGATGMRGGASQPGAGGTGESRKQVAPPPVLPGTKSATEAAPATAETATLSPTEGLFDAVNRGDLAAARDAVNRGANLDAPNVLGLTALELAVDLGRNDIAFMLMSMRGEDPAAKRAQTADVQPVAPSAPVRRRAQAAIAPPDEPRLPRYSSGGGGGAPIPSAGFLGFR